MVIFQGITILMARNHYTMDVVIASYVTPLLWHWCVPVGLDERACAV